MDTRLTQIAICAGITLSSTLAIAGPIYQYDFETSHGDEAGVWSNTTRGNLGGPYTRFLGRFNNQSVSMRLNANATNTAGLGNGNGDSGGDNGDQGDGGPRPFNLASRPVNSDRRLLPYPDEAGGGSNPPIGSGVFDNDGPSLDLGGAVNGGGSNGGEPPSDEPLFTQGTYALTFDLMLFDSWDAGYEGYGPDSFRVDINGETVFDELLEIHWLPNNFRMPDELPTQNAYNQAWQDQIYRDITIHFEIADATDHFDFEFIGSLNQSMNDESWGIDNIRIDAIDPVAPLSVPSVPTPASITLLGAGLGLMGSKRRR